VARTKAENVYASRPGQELSKPSTSSATPVTTAAENGTRNVLPSERSDARRHATSGPSPINSSSGSPKVWRKKS
jgi:hypothetical protein